MGVRCTHCDVLSRADAVVCRACGHPLPDVGAARPPAPPVPPPPTPPTVLRMRQPAPLKPPSLDVVPPARPKAPPSASLQGELFVAQSEQVPGPQMAPQRAVPPPRSAPRVAGEGTAPTSAARPQVPYRSSQTPLPADTVPPDTLPPDTVPPDTLPPDTVPPDTVPPDTAPPDTLPPDTLPPTALPRASLPPAASPRAVSLDDGATPTAATPTAAMPPPRRPVPDAPLGRELSATRSADGGPVATTYRIAGATRLVVALLIDLLLAAAPGVALVAQVVAPDLSSVVVGLAAFGVGCILLHALCVPRWGGTPGALVTGLRLVTKAEGAAVGMPRAALRGALGAIETLCFLLGPLWAVWLDPEARTLADRILGVVPVERQGQGR